MHPAYFEGAHWRYEANPQEVRRRVRRGHTFRQEHYAGHAEDHFAVVDLSTPIRVPAGAYRNAMLTKEWTPLEPDVLDHKYYVREIAEVREVSVKGGLESLSLVTRSGGATPR